MAKSLRPCGGPDLALRLRSGLQLRRGEGKPQNKGSVLDSVDMMQCSCQSLQSRYACSGGRVCMVSGKSERNKAARPRQMTLAAVRGFMEAIAASNPEPETELDYSTPYSLLVAVVMSAQATDVSVNRVSRTLFAEAPNPEAMVRLGVDGVARHIRSIGLWQAKARNVVELSRQLIEKHHGEVPH